MAMAAATNFDWNQPTPGTLHRDLAAFNRQRLTPTHSAQSWRQDLKNEMQWRIREAEFVEEQRARVLRRAVLAPTDADGFIEWFEALERTGPGQHDGLFDWLEQAAPREAMIWFLTQEVAGEAGFEDLVALTQVKLPTEPKLELARNYWDEMGQGQVRGMHGPMLESLARELEIPKNAPVVWESLALGNLMTALACNRHYAFQSIGALGVIELTAPGRAAKVNAGLKRLGVDGDARRYFALHATLDVKHSASWNREVLYPIVRDDAGAATAIAEGALMRLEAGKLCFERYRRELMVTDRPRDRELELLRR